MILLMPLTARRVHSTSSRWWDLYRTFAPFGRRHRRCLIAGGLVAFVVVAIRLILPWPLRALMEPWLAEPGGRTVGLLTLLPAWINPTVAMGGLFLLLILSLGLMDYLERWYFARFAIGSIRDLRAEAFKQAVRVDPEARVTGSGDLVARLIGDTARIKAGLKGFLVHVATNGVMFLGVSAVLMWIDLTLGLIFIAAGVLVGLATAWGAAGMFRKALKYRTKEGELADFIHESSGDDPAASAFAEVNRSSGQHEAALTRIQGVTTCSAHVVLGVAVVAALCVGVHGVSVGRLSAGDLLVVMMYALMIRAPIVQLARQGARTGKILACGDRLQQVLRASPDTEEACPTVSALEDRLELIGASVSTRRSGNRHRRLGPIDLGIEAGQRIAVLGRRGSGKTAFLELIAGLHRLRGGRILWDGRELAGDRVGVISKEIVYLPHNPTWQRRPIRSVLRLPDGTPDAGAEKCLRACGVHSIIERLPNGLDSAVASSDLSFGERKGLALAGLIRSDGSVWLLDDPVGTLKKPKARKVIKRILDARPAATVIVALSRPVRLKRFHRIIRLRRGRVVFDGPPAMWRAWSEGKEARDVCLIPEEKPASP